MWLLRWPRGGVARPPAPSAHLFQLTPHAHPSVGHFVREDEVQLLRADAERAGFGKLGYHGTDPCGGGKARNQREAH